MKEQTTKKSITNHPFVVKNDNMCGGSPIIVGTRARVIDIAIEYEVLGRSPDEIVNSHPHLDLSQVHDALSYYYENREDLDRKIEEDEEFVRSLRSRYRSKLAQAYAEN